MAKRSNVAIRQAFRTSSNVDVVVVWRRRLQKPSELCRIQQLEMKHNSRAGLAVVDGHARAPGKRRMKPLVIDGQLPELGSLPHKSPEMSD